MLTKKLIVGAVLQALLQPTLLQIAKCSEIDDISSKCAQADTAQTAGKLDEAKENLLQALQLSWKIPLKTKPADQNDAAKIAAMSQDEKRALAEKEYADSVSDVVVMSVPMALGMLCDSYEKAAQFDSVMEIHEWLIKNDQQRGGAGAKADIALNQIMMAKAALNAKQRDKATTYYTNAMADEKSWKSQMSLGQLQNFSTALKDYSEVLKVSGAAEDAAKVSRKSDEYKSLGLSPR